MSTTRSQLPNGDTVERLKAIAAQSSYALLTEGPVNPDHQLLDLCATTLHHLAHAQKAKDARKKVDWTALSGAAKVAAYAEFQRLYGEYQEGEALGKPQLRLITKMKAKTAAGVYAKAMVVRASKTGAASLAMSLAQDLLDCPGLRASLWPAGEGE